MYVANVALILAVALPVKIMIYSLLKTNGGSMIIAIFETKEDYNNGNEIYSERIDDLEIEDNIHYRLSENKTIGSLFK
jgi:hypothetical protein